MNLEEAKANWLQCGAGVFMAAMHNRQYCGKCHLTYVFDESK